MEDTTGLSTSSALEWCVFGAVLLTVTPVLCTNDEYVKKLEILFSPNPLVSQIIHTLSTIRMPD